MRIDRAVLACCWLTTTTAWAGPGPLAWVAGPMEVRVAFPAAQGPDMATGLVGREIPFAATNASASRLGALKIAGARLEDAGRTLVLATDPHPRDAAYELPIDDPSRPGRRLGYTLAGVEATWEPAAGEGWSSWLPGFDLPPKGELSAVSAGHARRLADLAKPGKLTMRGLVSAGNGKVSMAFAGGSGPFVVSFAGESATSAAVGGAHSAKLDIEADGEPVELVVTLTCRDAPATLRGPDSRPTLGWAPAPLTTTAVPAAPPFALKGGDATRGEAVFRSEVAKCATCHQVGGIGGLVGPSLDAQAGKDLAAIYQSIAEPSAAIHPDYVPYTVALKGGKVAVGVVRAEGSDKLRVADINAQATIFDKSDVEELRPSATSIMPVGLAGAIGEAGMRDLLAYLSRRP